MLLLVGFLAGTMLLTPAGAHFRERTKHLNVHAWRFIRSKVYTRNQIDRNVRMWARVGHDGKIYQKRGPVASATKLSGDGVYAVRFERPVLGCSAQATAWSSAQRRSGAFDFFAGHGALPNRYASVGAFFPTGGPLPTEPDPRRLSVGLRADDGTLTDGAFTLHVVC